jgi:threonylcarbamoyladenosine tRNA methylthiotransferase MtaB
MRVYFHTFGCKANQYDTEVVRQALTTVGAEPVTDLDQADLAVVNSCTVTHVGEAKMRGLVRRLRRRRPEIRTVVMGCAAAVDDGTIAALPGVTGVIGGADPEQVIRALGLDPPRIDPVLRAFPRGSRGWLKVQDGCDEHCTFCATRIARGLHRSRDEREIVAEAQALAEHHEELVITGVHIGSYGSERPPASLGRLVRLLIEQVPRVRFRLSSVEATEVDEALVELMTGAPDRLAPHLHAPLQSGSDRILRRMGRHWYTAGTYAARCEDMAARLSAFGLGADVMVGFPGETDADHAATKHLIAALPFTYLHVFPYSQRPGTAAVRLGTPVDAKAVAARTAELREMAEERGLTYRRAQDGRRADVVVLDRSRGRFRGLTEDYLEVYLSADRALPPRTRGTLALRRNGALDFEFEST